MILKLVRVCLFAQTMILWLVFCIAKVVVAYGSGSPPKLFLQLCWFNEFDWLLKVVKSPVFAVTSLTSAYKSWLLLFIIVVAGDAGGSVCHGGVFNATFVLGSVS